ncbi:MAG TPA: DsbC family protein [Desulfuromonadales bacterium]|nr:DsbC family protein [Desulfuromonadales bacterium]
MKKLLPLLLVLCWAIPAHAFMKSGCGAGKCIDCHKLDVPEATKLLHKGVDKVLRVELSEVPGFWLVEAEKGNHKFPLYIDFSKKYVFAGNIYRLQDRSNVTSERQSEFNKVDVSKIPVDDALLLGSATAKIKVIVFTDPECPYCKRMHAEMKKVVKEDPNVAFLLKMFPLKIHPGSRAAAESIVCSKSLKLLQASYDGKQIPPPLCETKVVDQNVALAHSLGIHSTPTMVLPDGRVFSGYKPAAEILRLLGQSAATQQAQAPPKTGK